MNFNPYRKHDIQIENSKEKNYPLKMYLKTLINYQLSFHPLGCIDSCLL